MTPPLSQRARAFIQRLKYAFTKGGGTYPIKGIYYFATHRFLWPLIKTRLLPCTLLSLFVTINLFLWTYLPQVAVLALFHKFRGSAWLNGTVLVLSESAIVTALLFEAFFVDETQVDIFDAVLVDRGLEDLVRTSRPVLPASSPPEDSQDGADASEGRAVTELNPRTRLQRPTKSSTYYPLSLRQILEFILLLPLNLVPYIGVPLFLLLTGYRAGPLLHWRYFSLRGFNRKQRRAYVRQRQWEYTWFGSVYLVLQLVPVFSMLFLLTSAAGSGLWAADVEHERLRQLNQEAGEEGADGGRYRDYDDGEAEYAV